MVVSSQDFKGGWTIVLRSRLLHTIKWLHLKIGDVSRIEIDGLGATEARVEAGSGEFLLR